MTMKPDLVRPIGKMALAFSAALWLAACADEPGPASGAETDTGVGPNGVALPSSPAFVAEGGEPVTMDNVVRAETAKYFAEETIKSGPNTFRHERDGIQLDNQTVIRSNFDLIYSYGVYDASKGLEISVPPYDLYHIVHVFDENHVTLDVVYPGETKTISPDQLTYGDHVYLFMRTQPPSTDAAGMDALHERQDSVTVKAGSSQPYVSEVKYDVDSFNTLRNDLIARAPKEDVVYKGFIEDLDDIISPYYQMTNLAGWGGLPSSHAYYFVVAPGDEGARTGEPASVTFPAPPIQADRAGYWSLTVYNADGWVKTDPFKISSLEATPNEDGTYTLNFNGPEGSINNLQAPENWNALFRAYLPTSLDEILAFQTDMDENRKVLSGSGEVPLLTLDEARTLETTLPGQTDVPVTKKTFAFANLDVAMQREIDLGATNTFYHHRKPMELDKQPAVLMNRDTLYSFAIIDSSHGATVTLPEGDGRYMSLHVMQHDHVTDDVYYGGGEYTIDPDTVTQFLVLNIRTQVNPNDPDDVAAANAIQDQYQVTFPDGYSPKAFQVIDWDEAQLKALVEHYSEIADSRGVSNTMAPRGTLPQEDINVGAAVATGLLPDKDAWYSFNTYDVDQATCYSANYPVPEMANPQLGFYSMTIYGEDMYLHTEEGSSLSNHEIELDEGGETFTLYYGSPETCGDDKPNLLTAPTDNWTLAFRVYMPGQSVQNNEYTLPTPAPVE